MAKTEKIALNGFEMRYTTFGRGAKKLVILPGLSVGFVTDQAGSVIRAYRSMTDDYTIWLFDRREVIPERYGFAEMARDTLDAMEALGIEKASLLGTSQGGMLALCAAMLCPERVEKLILGSTAPKTDPILRETMTEWIAAAERGDSKELNKAFIDRLYGKKTLEKRDMLLAVSPDYTEAALRRFVILAATMLDMNLEENLRKIACPVLVLGCEADRVVGPEGSYALARKLNAELYMYGCEYGHAVYDEAPDYIDRVKAFLNSTTPKPSPSGEGTGSEGTDGRGVFPNRRTPPSGNSPNKRTRK